MTSPVLIIGAGLGGLTLAQSLRKHNVPFLIFERDESATSRGQGWSLGLSWIIEPLLKGIISNDKPSLKAACIDYALGEDVTIGGDGSCFMDGVSGEMLVRGVKKFEDVTEYRVNRANMRAWLRIGVEIQWGKRFVEYVEDDDGVEVIFADGSKVRGSVLVGADGVSSHVRQQLFAHDPLQAVPSCLPITIWASQHRVSFDRYQENSSRAPALTGAYGDDLLFFESLVLLHAPAGPSGPGADYLWFVSSVDADEKAKQDRGESRGIEWAERLQAKSSAEGYAEARARIESLVPFLRNILEEQKSKIESGEEWVQPLFLREVKVKSVPRGRVTLLGDAAHAMSIYHGVAGNHAMLSGLKLGPLLMPLFASEPGKMELEDVLQEYAKEMLARGEMEQTAARVSTFAMHKSLETWRSAGKKGLREGGRGERKVWGKHEAQTDEKTKA